MAPLPNDHREDVKASGGRKPSTAKTCAVVGAGALAASAAIVAVKQLSGIKSVGQLELYGNPVAGPVLRVLFAKSIRTVGLEDQGDRLTAVPKALLQPSFSHVVSLNLAGSCISDLPEGINVLSKLAKLNLARCKFTQVPPAIGGLTGLIDLDMSRNEIATVSPEISKLCNLKYLNLMSNAITSLPDEIGQLTSMYRLGLKSNQLTALPEGFGGLVGLVELFITDNKLKTLPASFGKLTSLFKLQASFNELESLPAEMGCLPNLELMRVAVNNIAEIPDSFSGLDRLAWFSLAGNPACPEAPAPQHDIDNVAMSDMQMGAYLGEGASGEVFKSGWRGKEVAVKVYKAEVSPDGRAKDEIDIALFVDHPNLTRTIGRVDEGETQALVKELVLGKAMADKPNFASLLRCRWRPGLTFKLKFVLRVAASVARALKYLHANGICHGDVYAHNVLADEAGNGVLCDYGASFFYSPAHPVAWQPMEVRAFGLLLKDLVERLEPDTPEEAKHALLVMVHACCFSGTTKRPLFAELCHQLEALMEKAK